MEVEYEKKEEGVKEWEKGIRKSKRKGKAERATQFLFRYDFLCPVCTFSKAKGNKKGNGPISIQAMPTTPFFK